MSELLCDGSPVLSAVIEAHREGAWSADLVLDGAAIPEGIVSVTDSSGAVLLRGHVLRAEAPFERAEVRLVGGARLGTILPPRYYRAAPARTVLQDIARESGAELAADLASDVDRELPAWVRVGGEDAVTAIRHLLRAALPAGWTWRTRFDGSLWLGADSWLDVVAPGVEVVDRKPSRGELVVRAASVAELLAIEPGMVFEGIDVTSVRIDATGDRLRAVVRTTANARRAGDVITHGIRTLAREATVERALLAMYEATVLGQLSADGLVDVLAQPDTAEADRTIPQLTKVPLVAPYPGAKVLFPSAAIAARSVRVLVGFAGGDPAKPYAVPWSLNGAAPDRIEINAAMIALGGDAKGVARQGDSVGRNEAMTTWMEAVASAFQGLGVTLTPIVGGTIGTVTSASAKVKTS